jgi:hypothetical protein
MANYTNREENRADIARMIEAGIEPPRFPMPRCEICGDPAAVCAYPFRGNYYFCDAHRAEAGKEFGAPDLRPSEATAVSSFRATHS